ncbi:MAG: peptidoglycan DD-metalloendopeptidase family protein [Bacillota bacterium]
MKPKASWVVNVLIRFLTRHLFYFKQQAGLLKTRFYAGKLKAYHFIVISTIILFLFLGLHTYLQGFAYVVYLDGQEMGMVNRQEEVTDFIMELTEKCTDVSGYAVEPDEKITLERQYIPGSEKAIDAVHENIRREITLKTRAFMITVDDNPLAAVASKKDLILIKEKVKELYSNSDAFHNPEDKVIESNIEISSEVKLLYSTINEHLDIIPCKVKPVDIFEAEEVVNKLITQSAEIKGEAAVASGNSEQGAVASRYAYRIFNPGFITADLGDNPKYGESGNSEAMHNDVEVSVTTVEEIRVMKKIPYETESLADDSMWVVESKIETPGEHGMKEEIYHLTRENGKEIERFLVSETVLKEPVTQVELYGTAQVPAKGTGRFIWPVENGGEVTPGRGFSSWHTGIDIDSSAGTNVLAADSGVVWFSGYGKTQGKYLIVYHGSYWTLYLHNEVNSVSEGDIVSQGDVIAKVGSTGRTTGAHLHFEIRRDDGTGKWHTYYQHKPIDPLRFINP